MTMSLGQSRFIADLYIILKCLALSKVVHLGYVYQTECLNCNFLSSECKLNNGSMHSYYLSATFFMFTFNIIMLTLVDCRLMYPGTPWDKTTYKYVDIIDSHLDMLHLAF